MRPKIAAHGTLITVATVGIAILGAVVVVPLSFGIMPGGFFEASCRLGESLGTRMGCFRFVWDAFATGIYIGIVGPVIGVFLVHREMALIGETLAHTAFAGVAIGTLFVAASQWSATLLLVALVAAVVGAFGVQYLAERTGSYGDVPIAIVLTGSFAVGTLVISIGGGFATVDIHSILFGSISTVTRGGVRIMAVLSLLVVAAVAITYRQLLFITFDEEAARVARLNVTGYNVMLVVLTAMVIVGSMQILGVILVAAMLVVPVATASQLASSFREMVLLSVVVGETSVIIGMVLSYSYALAPGATIVVIAIGFYLTAVRVSDRGISTGTIR